MICVIYIFVLGTVIASFVNVAASGKGTIIQNITRKRSQCERCGKKLKWWELIPVFSWLVLRGRCSKCKKPIAVIHPISEFVLGSIFLITYFQVESIGQYILLIIPVIVMYYFSIKDFFAGIVPNKIVFPVIILTFCTRVAFSILSPTPLLYLIDYVSAGVIYFLFFASVNFLSERGLFPGVTGKKQGFGWGDAKYAVFLGLLLGIKCMFVAMWVSIFAGSLISVILFFKYKNRNMAIPYAPFMSIGAWIAMLWCIEIADYVMRFLII